MEKTTKLAKPIIGSPENKDWFKAMVEECRSIIVEAVFTSNWSLLEGYHQLGERILAEKENFEKIGLYGKKINQKVAVSIGKSTRTVERAVQFYEKFPDLNKLPEGKSINWHKIVNKYLPIPKEGDSPEIANPNSEITITARKLADWVFKIKSTREEVVRLKKMKMSPEVKKSMEMIDEWLELLEDSMKTTVEKL